MEIGELITENRESWEHGERDLEIKGEDGEETKGAEKHKQVGKRAHQNKKTSRKGNNTVRGKQRERQQGHKAHTHRHQKCLNRKSVSAPILFDWAIVILPTN